MALEIIRLPVLRDNYVFVLADRVGRRAAVVDPAVAAPVIDWLDGAGCDLTVVLQTHHHSDHIGGTPELLRRWPQAEVWAAASDRERIPFQTRSLADGDRLELLGRPVEVLLVPGHTRAHLAFMLPAAADAGPELFCGDTLFAGGCGRLFEGTPSQLFSSLERLAALPADTRVWCAHEYTEANLRFAASVDPRNGELQQRIKAVAALRAAGEATVPSRIDLERATNPFLRCRTPALQQAMGQQDPMAVLAELRRRKDGF
jgi:hydroxyacylglutathione hydrolase